MCWREIRKGQAGATKISSPSGKTLILTFPSSSKPGQSTRNWSNSNAPTKTAKRLDTPKVPRHNEVTFATDDRRFSRLVPSHGLLFPNLVKEGLPTTRDLSGADAIEPFGFFLIVRRGTSR